MVVISTAGSGAESTLAKLRKRALAAPDVRRRGALTDARGPSLRMLEWAVDPERPIGDTRAPKQANPVSWQTAGLREQRDALPELAYRRYHLSQWTEREGSWSPPGAWAACIGRPTFEPAERIWAALDVGGVESATALTWINESLQVGCWIETAEDAILRAVERVRELRETFALVEFI